ncbi:hypothetical protein CK203_060556 [Vitis vinifera]|uniref:Uncharacterized protein n=1 Tax=Vitis vinifera TaxID=29760 RepID=A0A438GDU6_VITVI|nr:hypothetical protein CK203_060556 [Vitis vinifera]
MDIHLLSSYSFSLPCGGLLGVYGRSNQSCEKIMCHGVAFCPYINMDYTVIPEQIRRKMYLGRSSTMMICFDKAMTAP